MSSWPRLLLLLVICIAAGYLVGRRFWTDAAGPATPATQTATAVTRMPGFALNDLSGVRHSIGEWSSQALILNFWATWCAPCREEMPLLEQVHLERSGASPVVIGVAIDHEEPVRTFVAETGVTYPILVGQEDATAAAESFGPGFVGLPMTVIAAPGGAILKLHTGQLHPADLTRILDVLDRLAAGKLSLDQAREALRDT